jgi:hypothetical protein
VTGETGGGSIGHLEKPLQELKKEKGFCGTLAGGQTEEENAVLGTAAALIAHGAGRRRKSLRTRPLPYPESIQLEMLKRVYGGRDARARIVYFFIITLESI